MRHKGKLRLLLVLLVSLGLRLVNLNQSLWLDEAIEWWAVKSFGLRELLTGYMIGDFNPPGHHVLMWFWVRMFGESEIALRMPSVIFGVGIVWWVYRIASLLRSDLGARLPAWQVRQGRTFPERFFPELAAGMAAVNGLLIYYSQEARMYAMAAFFAAGAMYFFMKGEKDKREKKDKKDYLLYFGFMGAAMYSHYLTWLILPFLAIWGVRYLAPLLLTTPWWSMLVKQLSAGMAAAGNPVWAELSRTNFKNLALVAVKFVTGRVPWPEAMASEIVIGSLVIGYWVLVGIGIIRLIREIRQIRDFKLMLIFWAFGPLTLGVFIGLFVPVFGYFRFLFVAPAVIVLAAVGGSELGKLGKFGKLGALGVMLIFSGWYLLVPGNHREDWRGAVEELHRQDESAAVIIHPAVRPPFDYYDRGNSAVVVERFNLASARLNLMNLSIWYIPYAQPIFDPEDRTRKFLRDEGYVRTFERHFRGVTLERWNSGIASL